MLLQQGSALEQMFVTAVASPISLKDYLKRFVTYAKPGPEALVMVVVYLQRIAQASQGTVGGSCNQQASRVASALACCSVRGHAPLGVSPVLRRHILPARCPPIRIPPPPPPPPPRLSP